jgi:hypothetical protein
MKKISLLTWAILLTCITFAEPELTECSSNKIFDTNTCEVCYTDTFEATETKDGWISNITDVKIPWKHAGGEKAEIIYDNEQKFPEIKTTLKYSTKPTKPQELWTNHESLVWTPFSDHKEVFIKKSEEIGLYTLANSAGITVNGSDIDSNLLFVTPLVVRDFDVATNEESASKTRNICVLWKFAIKKDGVAPVSNELPPLLPLVDKEDTILTETALENAPEESKTEEITTQTGVSVDENIPALNAASEEDKTVITAEQTKAETGPVTWIALLLAFVLSSAWSAWKKQKV